MPVIVVGADTKTGASIIEGFIGPGREVRAFVTDPETASRLKGRGVKVALGDVSDDGHVQWAALNVFTAVLVAEAARDNRERSFAATEDQVLAGWASAMRGSRVSRVIWVHDGPVPEVSGAEVAVVPPDHPRLVDEVRSLDDARTLS